MWLLVIGIITLAAARALAAPPAISVQHAWSRATPPGAETAVVYLTVIDHGAPDQITALETPVAAMAQMHQTMTQNQISKMLPVDTMPVSPTRPAVFAPGGYHIMLTGLKQALVKGQSFPITLIFQHQGKVQASVTVGGLGADAAPMGDMDMSMPMPPQHGQ